MEPSGDVPVKVLGPPAVDGVELELDDELVGAAASDAAAGVATTEDESAEATIAEASAGEIVAVLVLTAALFPPRRASWPSIWGCVSMKAIAGPATSCVVARSRTLLIRGWPSEVMKIATGPLMPGGTTQLSNGRGMEKGWPPSIIWQKSFEVSLELVMAGLENDSWVPGPTLPVFVRERAGLDGRPTSQGPSKKGPARARTSLGVSAMSNAAGMAVPLLDRTLRIVW